MTMATRSISNNTNKRKKPQENRVVRLSKDGPWGSANTRTSSHRLVIQKYLCQTSHYFNTEQKTSWPVLAAKPIYLQAPEALGAGLHTRFLGPG